MTKNPIHRYQEKHHFEFECWHLASLDLDFRDTALQTPSGSLLSLG